MACNLIPRNGSACRDQRSYSSPVKRMSQPELHHCAWVVSNGYLGGPLPLFVIEARQELERRVHAQSVRLHEMAAQKEGFGL